MCYPREVIEDILKENGLNDKEAKVYLAALSAGEATVASIASNANLERTTVYSMLDDMERKGLLSVIKRKGIQYISALPPRVLVDRFKQSATHAEQLLPELLQMAYASPLKPRIRFYDGLEGIKEILVEFSHSRTPCLGFTDYAQMPPELFKFLRKTIVPNRRSRKIEAFFVVPRNETNSKLQKEDDIHFAEHRLVDFPMHTNPLELNLFDISKVGFLSYTKEELFGVVIDSPAIYSTLKNLFLLVWQNAKPGPFPLGPIR